MIIRLVGNLGYTVNLFFIDLVLLILALSLLILLFLVFKKYTKRSATTICSKFRLFYLASWILDAISLNLMNCYVIFKRWLFPSLLVRCKCEITILKHLVKFRDLNYRSGLFPFWLLTLSPIVCLIRTI